MKVYICIKSGEVLPVCYTTLVDACGALECSYDAAMRGKREFKGDKKIVYIEVAKSMKRNNSKNFEKFIKSKVDKAIESIANGTNKGGEYEAKFAEYERDKDEYREA